jgi:hypothetical protein
MAAADDVVVVVCSAASLILFECWKCRMRLKNVEENSPYLSLAMLEFLDIDFGDISKSESDR